MIRYVVVALGFVLIVDALFGEGGLLATMRARHDYDALKTYVARLQEENAQLREQARQLREDPQAIEAIAREELGLIYPGETLFIVKDHSRRPIP
jgi:cell division protein FtsB